MNEEEAIRINAIREERVSKECPVTRWLKINTEQKREEIMEILHNPEATNNQKIWLFGFLAYCGYSYNEIEHMLIKHGYECPFGKWSDFSEKEIKYQINYFKNRHGYEVELSRKNHHKQ
jgi:hypothetical protein